MKKEIIEALKEVYDPEIPVNVYDLGLIYDISYDVKNNRTDVLLTLTSPTCPTADYIQEMIKTAVEGITGGKCVVTLTFDPPWSVEKVLPEVREELGFDLTPPNSKQKDVLEKEEVLNPENQPPKDDTCFNCSVSSSSKPLLKCLFSEDENYICFECLKKF